MRKTAIELKIGDYVYQKYIPNGYVEILTVTDKMQIDEKQFQFCCKSETGREYVLFAEASHQGYCSSILSSSSNDNPFCVYINADDVISDLKGDIGFRNIMIQKIIDTDGYQFTDENAM